MTEIIVLTSEEIEKLESGEAVVLETRENKRYHIMSEATFNRFIESCGDASDGT